MRGFFASMTGIAVCVAAAVAVLVSGLDSWFVADDFFHLGYIKPIDHTWRSFYLAIYGTMIFRPLTFIAEFYEGLAFGLSPRAIHTVDLVNHCINTGLVFILVYFIFRRDDGSAASEAGPSADQPSSPILPAFAGSLIFAVHPVSAMTAVWFACRADLMATAFSLMTLVIIAGRRKNSAASLIAAGLSSLCALLCKPTYLPLFLAAFLVAFGAGREGRLKERLRDSAVAALPVFNAALIYFCWRVLVLEGPGGYQAFSGSLSGTYYQMAYHLPRVGWAALRDLLCHHMEKDHVLFLPLAASGVGLLVLGVTGALSRRQRHVILGILFIAVALAPVWNLSHMLTQREERLLYFPLAGFALLAATLVSGPKSRALRAAAMSAVVFAAAFYGLYSSQSVVDWRAGSRDNQKLARAVANYIEPLGTTSEMRRIYVLGLEPEHYLLDTMVKMELDPAFHDREIMAGDEPSFIFILEKMRGELSLPDNVPENALPKRRVHSTDPNMIFETTTPPDLLEAARHDPGARVLEWNGVGVTDITLDLKRLYSRRAYFQQEGGKRRWQTHLPSFSFRKSPLELKWEPSPGLAIIEPLFNGEPYTFAPENNDPYIISPKLSFPALAASRLDMDMKLPEKPYLAPGQEKGCIMWEGKDHPGYSPQRSICFPVTASGEIEHYSVELHSNVYWARSGMVTGLRLDPVSFKSSFELIRLEFATWQP